MKIQSVHIRNYRKLKNCHIDFGEKETVFVGANNSGKTSAISAIVWFLKNTDRFTLKEFTATNWASINKIGDKWLEHDSVDEALLSSHQWDNIVPSMDVWINVEDGEQYRVNHLIPSLSSWDGKKVGVRGQYEPKDVTKLYTVYKEAKMKAKTLEGTEEWENAGSIFIPDGPTSNISSLIKNIYFEIEGNDIKQTAKFLENNNKELSLINKDVALIQKNINYTISFYIQNIINLYTK